ncbi:MAG: Pycsar system effector family protein [Chitinophagaceae bacterium]
MNDSPLKALEKDKKANRGIKTDSLLRETSSHFLRLIGDADRKARIMVVVNSIMLTIGVTILTKTIDNPSSVWISAIFLIIANLLTLFFSVVSIQPELHSNIDKEVENHMLHYKKCEQYPLAEYITLMMNTMQDNEQKMDAAIKDLYYFGNLLNQKYKFIKTAYRFFYWGILVSIFSYLVILLINHL